MRENHVKTSFAVPASSAWDSGLRKKGIWGSIACHRAVLTTAVTALLPSAHALAQCAVAPAALSISSGSCSDPASTTRESAGSAPVVEVSGSGAYSGTSVILNATGSGYGAHATGGGKITLTGTSLNSTSITTDGADGHGLHAEDGGQITGSNTIVYTNGAGAYGARAIGRGSSVSLVDSELNTALDGAHGAYAASGGAINLTRTNVTTLGAGASAVFTDTGGAITLDDLSTFSYGDNAPGAAASGVGSRLTLNNAYVNVYGNGSPGLSAAAGGQIDVDGSAIVTGDYYGNIVIANSPGILARGAGSVVRVIRGATSATYGANSPGLWADAGGRIAFAGYGVFTYQPSSPGAAASGGSTIALTGTIVRTSGPSGAGVLVTDAGSVTVADTEITTGFRTTGGNPPALQFPDTEIGLEAHGADVVGAGSQLQAERTSITTNGDGAIGVRVSQGAVASIVGGAITTRGADTVALGGADGARATDVGSRIALSGTSVTTTNANAVGLHAMAGGTITATDAKVATQGQNAFGASAQDAGSAITLTGTAMTTAGNAAHGVAAANGGTVTASGTTVAVSGAGSAAIHLTGGTASTVSVTGGSLSAAHGAIVLAEGGTGIVSISGGTAVTPAVVDGRLLLARVTENAAGTPSDLTLNIANMPSLAGDIVVDPSALAYRLVSSNWTGNLALTGSGNTASADLSASQWTGDLQADAGNTADVALAQSSVWTGMARNATDVSIDALSVWNVTGDSNATGTVANAGLVQFVARPGAYSTLTVGNYTGIAGSRIGFNTYLGADNSPTNLLVINGGQATGTTSVIVSNTGGAGAQTVADGIRLVQVSGGGTTAASAFTLGQRVAAGAYEYQLFRGGSTDPNDWFLRSHLVAAPTDPAAPSGTEIPLYRPEVALYTPIPAIARQMGLATLGTLHERVGEEENLRDAPAPRTYANGVWGRVFGQRVRNRWSGTVDASATGNLVGFQTGLDIFRRTTDSGHRDHAGVYLAYSDYHSESVRGFALGTQDLTVGQLSMNGPSVGGYWTHFGPSGWYLDAVFQGSWYDAKATSLYGAGLSTHATAYAGSLEAGYPVHFGRDGDWLIEPQAQIVYQGVSVDRSRDQYSSVDWDAGAAWTARLGARLQYTKRDGRGTLWQPYARINLWHAFSGTDSALFGQSSPSVEARFGNTALEVGAGVTAQVNRKLSFYGQASYRWSVGGGRNPQSATAGMAGVRFNW
ncbi:autotransporter outer membrane beta-barrel domain-containing protein [Pandoraea nosoerga]|uniref:Adhesin BmaC autotransporter n=1 Tax=Pandoraea nosoerga TaxID=2508296 RepID=A0A5E4XIS9_9BURK|nr:autotransporter outer membrane beta-barrel domain-containing protein [Pandoraea nosoerga]MBN4667229.1 autotransporter outer membrane beta-barrel domain-containing protein [Pandoraea nosoerga]MBN4677216.1 autotransporter outer membrane beta-barrel domain-containing protein [Pandoraea nosoerga]MBN4681962.1 autotransporter outer membrane beta-barrel domain-containing protein [Pandoraea nosoerga]MBN4746280.1 autotransporter outer membrane beta-barrel domain-containing protein [Pandoraea nosoerga